MPILTRLLGAERRATFRDPMHEWLADVLTGGNQTISGETISPSSAMGLSAYYAAIRAISEDVGKLPLKLYKRLMPKGKEELPGTWLYRLIHDAPNPEMSSQTFRETLTQHAMGWGNGFAEIVRQRDGLPLSLFPLDPSRVRIERDKKTRQLSYVVTDPDRTEKRLLPYNVFHVHGLGWDGVSGYSVAKVAKQGLGLAKAQEKSAAALFGNLGRPGTAIKLANVLSDEAKTKLARQFSSAFGGSDNWYKTVVLEQGTDIAPLSPINPEDAEWIEERQFSVEEVCRWFRIPPHKLQHLLRSTFDNISHQSIEYVVDTLLAWLKRWQNEIWRKLIPIPDQPVVFAEHVVSGLLQGDPEQQSKLFAAGKQWGWWSTNDIREKLNENPIGPEGDIHYEPVNMQPAGTGPKEAKLPQNEPEEPARYGADALIWAQLGVMSEAYTRLLHTEGDKAARAAKRGDLDKWADKFYASHVETAREVFSGPLWSFAGSLWASATGQPAPGVLRQIASNHAAEAAMRHVEKSRQRVEAYRDAKGTAIFDKRDDQAAREELRALAARIQPLIEKT